MNAQFFHTQWQRLSVRFGARAMDAEFKMLVTREVHDMSEHAFQRFVDVMIGSRSHNKPPLLSEFREARMQEQKLKFDNDVRGALGTMKRRAPEEMRAHMRAVLSKEFGGVETIADALEIARFRHRMGSNGQEGA